MKKIVLILVLQIFIIEGTSAQTYTQFPENIAVWDVYYQPSEPGFIEDHVQYTMKGDTVINNIAYNKIYSFSYTLSYPGGIKTIETKIKKAFSFGIRQDIANKKVYRTLAKNNAIIDTLLYDFDLQVGDTVPQTFTTPSGIGIQTVTAIDSIILRGKQYKRFKLKNIGTFGAALIEGVGSVNGFTEIHFGFFEATTILTDFCDSDLSDCSIPLALKIEEEHSDLIVNVFPNPFTDETTLNFTNEQPNRKAILYNILGKEIQTYNCNNKQSVIRKEELKNGIYFLKIIEGNNTTTKRLIVQ